MSVTTYNRAEEDFPRGGEDVITPLEKRSLHFQAQQDVLFGKVSTLVVILIIKLLGMGCVYHYLGWEEFCLAELTILIIACSFSPTCSWESIAVKLDVC